MVNARQMKLAVEAVKHRQANIDEIMFDALLELALVQAMKHGQDTAMFSMEDIDPRNYKRCRDKLKALGYTIKSIHTEIAASKDKFWIITW